MSINDEGQEQRSDVMELERERLVMETLGLNLRESKAMLERVQQFMVAQQATEALAKRRICPHCGERHGSIEGGRSR